MSKQLIGALGSALLAVAVTLAPSGEARAANDTYLVICQEEPSQCQQPVSVPEPGALGLLAFGLAGMGWTRRSRKDR